MLHKVKQMFADQELETEWNHVYETRIAILCGKEKPTQFMILLAKDEATEHVQKTQVAGKCGGVKIFLASIRKFYYGGYVNQIPGVTAL